MSGASPECRCRDSITTEFRRHPFAHRDIDDTLAACFLLGQWEIYLFCKCCCNEDRQATGSPIDMPSLDSALPADSVLYAGDWSQQLHLRSRRTCGKT